jgi:hypothetical protein
MDSTGLNTGKIKEFLVIPEKGNIVKVYLGRKVVKKHTFGIVIDTEVANVREEYEKDPVIRQILVLLEIEIEFKPYECDFCLPVSKVRFENWNLVNQIVKADLPKDPKELISLIKAL